jgi:hypothetical protein
MANTIKYTREQREKVCDMYNENRYSTGKYTKGRYTLRQIEEATGVNRYVVWNIANGKV